MIMSDAFEVFGGPFDGQKIPRSRYKKLEPDERVLMPCDTLYAWYRVEGDKLVFEDTSLGGLLGLDKPDGEDNEPGPNSE